MVRSDLPELLSLRPGTIIYDVTMTKYGEKPQPYKVLEAVKDPVCGDHLRAQSLLDPESISRVYQWELKGGSIWSLTI